MVRLAGLECKNPLRKTMDSYSHLDQIPHYQTSRRCGTASRHRATLSTGGLLWGIERETFGRARGAVWRLRHSAHTARGVLGDHAMRRIRLPTGMIHESPSNPSPNKSFSEMMVFSRGRGAQRKGRTCASTTGEWIMRRAQFNGRRLLLQMLLTINVVIPSPRGLIRRLDRSAAD